MKVTIDTTTTQTRGKPGEHRRKIVISRKVELSADSTGIEKMLSKCGEEAEPRHRVAAARADDPGPALGLATTISVMTHNGIPPVPLNTDVPSPACTNPLQRGPTPGELHRRPHPGLCTSFTKLIGHVLRPAARRPPLSGSAWLCAARLIMLITIATR
ncbi:hypothetical protein B0H11DRAFT_2359309 [Mycena galericulata]|nr:hypothetical protein B0H11DRAFT_2359309 [Mycena galericulata]